MNKINIKMQWYRALYRFYHGIAKMFLRLEHSDYLIEHGMFWWSVEHFEKYLKKANRVYENYVNEKNNFYTYTPTKL